MKTNPAFTNPPDKIYEQVRLQKELEGLTPADLAKKCDLELAKWHAFYPPDSGQHHLAMNEWNRRLSKRQAKVAYVTTLVGLVGTLLGTILGFYLSDSRTQNPQSIAASEGRSELSIFGQWRYGNVRLTIFRDGSVMLFIPDEGKGQIITHGKIIEEKPAGYKLDLFIDEGARLFFHLKQKDENTMILTAPTGVSQELKKEN